MILKATKIIKNHFLFYILLLFFFTISLTSCDKNDEPVYSDEEMNTDNGSNLDNGNDISSKVKENVKVSYSFNDYYVHIEMKHTLPSLFPTKNIGYEVGHGEKYDTDCLIINSSRNPVKPKISTSGSTVTVTFDYPFYYYFIYKQSTTSSYGEQKDYEEIYTECEMYLASYEALKAKSSLSKEEQELFASIQKYLNDYLKRAKGSYTVWSFVKIDNKSVTLGSYTI